MILAERGENNESRISGHQTFVIDLEKQQLLDSLENISYFGRMIAVNPEGGKFGLALHLTPMEDEVLKLLLKYPNKIIAFPTFQKIWNTNGVIVPGWKLALRMQMCRLKKKIQDLSEMNGVCDGNKPTISTVSRIGYRLNDSSKPGHEPANNKH